MHIEWGAKRMKIVLEISVLLAVFDFERFGKYKTEKRQSFLQLSLQCIPDGSKSKIRIAAVH